MKGVLRLGHNGTKKCDQQDKAPAQGNPQDGKSDVETEFKVHFNHHRHLVQRVQPVQPVQKQIVPRTAMHFEEKNPRPGDKVYQKICSEPSNIPEQKAREDHLRHYHQQFQNPPIFQQKLHYRPLEKILDLYKPQEVIVGHINTSHHEGLPLEDPDDSDFSEDSFSYASVQKKGKKGELVRERLSFFLHQSSSGAEDRKSVERGQGLSFNHSESQEQKQGISCDCTGSCGFSEEKPQHGRQNVWGSEEDPTSACDSSNISDAPEKPYSSQEELPNQPKKKSELSSKSSPQTNTSSDSVAEQEPQNRSSPLIGSRADRSSPLIGSQAGEATLSRDCYGKAVNNSSDSSSAVMAPLTVSLLQDNWSMESAQDFRHHSSPKSMGASKNGSFEKASLLESQIDEQSIEKNLSALVKKMLHYNESLQLQNSQHDKEWCLEAKDECKPPNLTNSPSFMAHQGSYEGRSSKPANMGHSPKKFDFSNSDSSVDFEISRSNDQICRYDADAEETAANFQRYWASPVLLGRKNPGKENDQKEILCLSPSDPFATSNTQSGCNQPASASHNRRQELSVEDAGLSSLEDSFRFPFKDSKLEHIKNKLLKCILAHQGNKEDDISLRNSKNKTTCSGQLSLSQVSSPSTREFEKAQ